MSDHEHRVLLLCPLARRDALNTWLTANLDPGGGPWLTVGLNPAGDGSAPTHYWCSAALRDDEIRRLLIRLCTLAGISAPAGWAGMTRAQKVAWLNSNLPVIRANTGIRVRVDRNEEEWSEPAGALTAETLKRRSAG